MFGQRAYIGPPMAKRLSIVCGLLLVALFAGLLGAKLLGGPFTSGRASDDRVQTERYALGRDIYHQDDYAVDTRYAPYTPGEKRIAKPTVAGARAIEPYEAARPAHRIEFSMDDGNFMEAQDLPRSDYGMIDPPAPARTDRAPLRRSRSPRSSTPWCGSSPRRRGLTRPTSSARARCD